MDLFPSIDLRGGRCVRLRQGDFSRETRYDVDPLDVARSYEEAGASWVHVVDLDAARTGEAHNRPVVAAIVAALHARVQVGGGVRRLEDAAALLDAGVSRVVIGTAAIESPELVGQIAARWPGQVAVGLDHRDGEVRLRGWVQESGRQVVEVVPELVGAGASAVIVTDIARDGLLEGPDLAGLGELLERTGAPLVASGGVSSLDDLRRLAGLRAGAGQCGRGLAGAIVGKALYEGRFGVADALVACGERPCGERPGECGGVAGERDLRPGECGGVAGGRGGVPGERGLRPGGVAGDLGGSAGGAR